jgi:hypothetical protein
MKIEKPEGLESNSFGQIDDMKASISEDSKSFLYEMMSKNLYSNPIGSIVREITSNCFDAHKEIGVDDPVIISKGNDEEGNYISFKDVGIGLSPERIKTIYMNYFSSTKRKSDDFIGGFGLGSKTPLSYADYFYISTNYNGKKYDYVLSMGDDSIPTLSLLYEQDTTERNGTEVKIHMKDWEKKEDYSHHWETRFKEELKSQLCYFDNVYFSEWGINNDYRLYETEYFKFRNKDQYSEEMHVVLGKVCYSINWKELGMNPIQIAVGIKFQIGELQVTPNRENLRYTDKAKALIKERVELAYNECLAMFREQNAPIENYFEWTKVKQKRPHVTFTTKVNDSEFGDSIVEDKLYLNYVEGINKRHRLAFANGISFLEDDNLLTYTYTFVGTVVNKVLQTDKRNKGRRYGRNYYGPFNLTPDRTERIFVSDKPSITELNAFIIENGSVFRETPITQIFQKGRMREICIKTSEERVKILDKKLKKEIEHTDREAETLDAIMTHKNTLSFGNRFTYFDVGAAKRLYDALKILRKQVREYWSIQPEPTQQQMAEFKEWKLISDSTRRRKKEGKVLCKSLAHSSSYTYEWKVETVKKENLSTKGRKYSIEQVGIEDFKGLVIYGFRKDTVRLKKAVTLIGQFGQFITNPDERDKRYPSNRLRDEAVRIIQISQQSEEFFIGKQNMTHVDNLFSDNHLFRQFASSLKIQEYLANTNRDMTYVGDIKRYIDQLKNICPEIGEHYTFLYEYWKDRNTKEVSGTDIDRADLKKEILNIADKYNLYDPVVEVRFKQVEAWFKGIEWMKFIEINSTTLPIILKELRDHKKKLSLEYYQKIVIEDKFTIKGVDKKQLSLELVIQEESDQPKFKILTNTAA